MLLHPAAAAAPPIGMFLGLAWYVQRARPVVVDRGVATYLATDRAGAALQCLGNAAERPPFPFEQRQGVSFRLGELAVLQGSSLPGVIPFSLPAHLSTVGRRRCCTYFVNLRGLTIHSSRSRFAARLNSGVRPRT